MSTEQLHDEIITLLIAGHETTANALAWTFYLLAKYPHIYKRCHKELSQVLAGEDPTSESLQKLIYTDWLVK